MRRGLFLCARPGCLSGAGAPSCGDRREARPAHRPRNVVGDARAAAPASIPRAAASASMSARRGAKAAGSGASASLSATSSSRSRRSGRRRASARSSRARLASASSAGAPRSRARASASARELAAFARRVDASRELLGLARRAGPAPAARSAPRARGRGRPRAPGAPRAAPGRPAARAIGRARAGCAPRAPHSRSTAIMRDGAALHQAARELLPHALGHERVDLARARPCARISAMRLRRDREAEARGEARHAQDAHRVFGEGLAHVAQHAGAAGRARRRADRSACRLRRAPSR